MRLDQLEAYRGVAAEPAQAFNVESRMDGKSRRTLRIWLLVHPRFCENAVASRLILKVFGALEQDRDLEQVDLVEVDLATRHSNGQAMHCMDVLMSPNDVKEAVARGSLPSADEMSTDCLQLRPPDERPQQMHQGKPA